MAKIGEQLLQPESGWKRYDDMDSNVSYVGELYNYSSQYHTFLPAKDKKIQFNFIGSKLRLIFATDTNGNYSRANISVDNKGEVLFCTNYSQCSCCLVYEITNLNFKEHFVTITGLDTNYLIFDAIDIDESGELKSYNPNLYKFLINQNNNYIVINPEFYKELGQPSTDTERNEWFEKYGADDLSVLTTIQNKKTETGIDKGNIGNGKYFEIPFNNNFLGVSEVR